MPEISDESPEYLDTKRRQDNYKLNSRNILYTMRKWSVELSTNQNNINNGVITTIQFDQIQYDCEGVGITSYGYQVKEAGKHEVHVHAQWQGTLANHRYGVLIYVNAVPWRLNYSQTSVAEQITAHASRIVAADVNDIITGRVLHYDGTNNPDLTGGTDYHTTMDVHILSRRCY